MQVGREETRMTLIEIMIAATLFGAAFAILLVTLLVALKDEGGEDDG